MATQPCAECGRRLKIRPRGRGQKTECSKCAKLTKTIKNRAACAARYKRVHGQGPAPGFVTACDIAAIFQAAAVIPALSASDPLRSRRLLPWMTPRDLATCDPPARSAPTPSCDFPSTHAAWFALRLHSRAEFKVRDALRAADIETFLPTFDEVTRWTDRTKITTRPLFTGYIFVRIPFAELHRARRVAGVAEVLGVGTVATPISDSEIESLRIAIESRVPLAPCAYVAGAAVRVKTGPLAGAAGVVTRSKGSARIVIAIEMLRRAVSVEIDAADVEATV